MTKQSALPHRVAEPVLQVHPTHDLFGFLYHEQRLRLTHYYQMHDVMGNVVHVLPVL